MRPVQPPTLDTCASEPIRIPAAIQPHGVLLAVRNSDFEVVVASANASEVFESDVANRKLEHLLSADSVQVVVDSSKANDGGEVLLETSSGERRPSRVHNIDDLIAIEIFHRDANLHNDAPGHAEIMRRFDCIRRMDEIEPLCEAIVDDVRAITSFDRVMVYRFDREGHGSVIAEVCDTDLEPFLGLHYPESDIPAQARELYVENPIRVIVDASYRPVPLVPAERPDTQQPLDLSHAALRSVSPIHCEYLQNMGVAASLSISIVVDGRLWGLVACHHRTPRHPDRTQQLACEFLANALSVRISELERIHSLKSKTAAYSIQIQLIEQMVTAPVFSEGLAQGKKKLTDLIPCDGAAVLANGELTCIGTTPTPDELKELQEALVTHERLDVFAEQRLSSVYAPAASWVERAAGVVGVPLNPDGRDWLFWFRGEQVRNIRWAGEPGKENRTQSGRLTPRGSFEEWIENVRGASSPWETWQIEIASDFRTALVAGIIHQASELARLNARLENASLHKDQMLATVSHELRNPLNAIAGWTKVARMGLSGRKLDEALETIERNVDLQARLIDDLLDASRFERGTLQLETEPIDLVEVIRAGVDSLRPLARDRGIAIDVQIYADSGEIIGDFGRLQQVVCNLLSNAIKFSKKDSAVEVSLRRESSRLELEVRDDGEGVDPDLLEVIFEPFRRVTKSSTAGLGLGLSIVKNIVELHGGKVAAKSEGLGQGLTVSVSLPIFAVRLEHTDASNAPKTPHCTLEGLSVLVVEDQPDSAKVITEILRAGGAEAQTAENGIAALKTLRETRFDVVVADLEMPEMNGFELVAALRDDPDLSDLPCVALTAFSRPKDRARALQAGFGQHVGKPVDPAELTTVIASLVGRL